MLPQKFKLHLENKLGAQIDFSTDGANNTFEVRGVLWKYENGVKVWSTEKVFFADPTADLANNGFAASAEYDNSDGNYTGGVFYMYLTTDQVSSGQVNLYIEWPKADGTYPSDATNVDKTTDLTFVKSLLVGGAQERATNFQL